MLHFDDMFKCKEVRLGLVFGESFLTNYDFVQSSNAFHKTRNWVRFECDVYMNIMLMKCTFDMKQLQPYEGKLLCIEENLFVPIPSYRILCNKVLNKR